MKKILLSMMLAGFSLAAFSQEKTSKERAEILAKNEFSKIKRKKVEKDGVVKEQTRIVESTPVIKKDPSFYEGNYVYEDLKYKIEIRSNEKHQLIATLKIGDSPETSLDDVSVQDAFFQATTEKENSLVNFWEGVFINKNDNGNVEFGLGLKLPKPVQLTEGLQITRIFLKKVSP